MTSRGPVQPAFLPNTTTFHFFLTVYQKPKNIVAKKLAVVLNVLLDSQIHAVIFLNNQNSDAVGGWLFCLF